MIKFYEVKSKKDKWMGSYSPILNSMENRPSALEQAIINAKSQEGGMVYSVNVENERTLVWQHCYK